jgi:hypothetical protein
MMKLLGAVLQFVNLFAAALLAGGQLFCLKTLVSARKAWSPELGTKVHQDAMTVRPDVYMKKAAAAATFTGFAVAGLDFMAQGQPVIGGLMLLGSLGQVANIYISARWEWPINQEINSWTNGPVLDRYPLVRDTWDEKHAWRTMASTLALICFTAAAVLRQRP